MRTSLLVLMCACTRAIPGRPAPAPPPTAAPLPEPALTLSPIGPPLTAATRLLDRPAAALALAWTHALDEHQQPVIVDRRLVLLEQWISGDPEQRYAVLDAATGAVASRGALPMAHALCPAEWRGHEPLSAPTRQCDPFALISFDLARQATRWQASLADNTIVFGDILGSIRGHTNVVRVDAGTSAQPSPPFDSRPNRSRRSRPPSTAPCSSTMPPGRAPACSSAIPPSPLTRAANSQQRSPSAHSPLPASTHASAPRSSVRSATGPGRLRSGPQSSVLLTPLIASALTSPAPTEFAPDSARR